MPLSSQIHRNRPLENISITFKSEGLIADALSPTVPVMKEANDYYVYSQDSLIVPTTLRANKGVANEATWNISTSSYRLEEHALRDLVSDRDRANADTAIRLDVDTTEYLTEKILLRREIDLQQLVQTTTTWSNSLSLTAGGKWNTATTNIITEVDSATSVIATSSGKKANVIVMNLDTFNVAKENTSTVDRVKFTSSDSIAPQMLAKLFNIDQLIVARAIQNTEEFGIDSVTMAQIWQDHVFIGYVERSPGLKKPSALYTLQGAGFGSTSIVKKYRDEDRGGDWIEVGSMFDHIAPATGCGFIIKDTL